MTVYAVNVLGDDAPLYVVPTRSRALSMLNALDNALPEFEGSVSEHEPPIYCVRCFGLTAVLTFNPEPPYHLEPNCTFGEISPEEAYVFSQSLFHTAFSRLPSYN